MSRFVPAFLATLCVSVPADAAEPLVRNGGFESGFDGWTRWGSNASLITLETGLAKSGSHSARIQHGHNALYFSRSLNPGQAYELRFAYRIVGGNPSGQIALAFATAGGPLRSAGSQIFKFAPPSPSDHDPTAWAEFRQVFLATAITATCQFAFTAGVGSTVWIDDVSLQAVERPAEMAQPTVPWEGLKRRTPHPLFKELLTPEPGHYTVVSWAHDLNPTSKELESAGLADPAAAQKTVVAILKESAEAGMGFMDLPGRLDGQEPWRTAGFHRELFRQYGVRYDVFSENSGSIAAALKRGAELLNPSAKAQGRRSSVSLADPAYVEAQCTVLRQLGAQLRGEPFVGYYYGKDEPSIPIPEGTPERWGGYGRAMAQDVLANYGYGRFAAPLPGEKSFLADPDRPLRWIAYNRWMNDKFIASRRRLSEALHAADPGARYSPANYWFMSGFQPYDFSRLAECSDLMECDPYASSAERSRGRGVFNHGFGAKFMSDLSGKPVRVVAQAFHYAGYEMSPDDLREWVSQALRCGASAIDYYGMDRPRWTDPARWKMMLHLSGVITRMNRIALPATADTAVLYALYTHMSHGASTPGDQVYAAHALLGELTGSWFRFISDAQLERGDRTLRGYKAVYLPLASHLSREAARCIEDYVSAGGVLVCGDPDAFSFDLAGNNTAATRERILGLTTVEVKPNAVDRTGSKSRRTSAMPDRIILTSAQWGLPAGTHLKLLGQDSGEDVSPGRAAKITPADASAEILGTYPDGSPAIVAHRIGKGRVITFGTNPFVPQVTVDASAWPAAFKGLQQSLGCKVDLPIWRFAIPAPMPAAGVPAGG